MPELIRTIKKAINITEEQPFSVYTSRQVQKLLNVPIAKPLLIIVLNGSKNLGPDNNITCDSGNFIFLSDNPAINMRNIPKDKEYFALLIEFDYQDFDGLQINVPITESHYIGKTTLPLELCLQQFVELSQWAPKQFWSSRKRELISMMCHQGYQKILSLLSTPQIKSHLHQIYIENGFNQFTIKDICNQLSMSESTLRRKLKTEGTSLQKIKDQARHGLALHLLQTTRQPIGIISDRCGYQSQSRFTERFKKRFGLTPSDLRKTQMTD